jgi:2'-5' RNA ligase
VRLFIAVNLPDALRRAIHDAAAPLRRLAVPVKWVDPEGLHVTVKFLGAVDAGRVSAIQEALERACRGARAFPLPVGGFGAFPTPRDARVIWVGCEAVPPLELLQHGIEREFAELGFPIEGRPFRPHLTLGRVRAGARGEMRQLEPMLARLEFAGEMTVRSVDLMESRTGPKGARYEIRHPVTLPG